ncbi:hypothetical protein BM477_06315 [Boudabousia marimammalium]|uniref:DUF3039 domain-containing protein n=2 Tax=Boudabousia marimammalium TaxID=156892 RepID=A0A1Q5PM51_9ACTO|nr:hypothetical protein BM477_06315 [Boudabousia marimammalium]
MISSESHNAPTGPEDPFAAPEPQTAGAVGVMEKPDTDAKKDDGDDERYAHYVRSRKAAPGRMVIALCGKVWIPRKNPKDYPVCPTCKAIYEASKNNGKGWPFNGDNGSGSGSDSGSDS